MIEVQGMNLPQVVLDYNKKMGSTKISTLSRAKALHMKRFFSGSFGLDRMFGGGAAFKRIQLYFGAKSAGKNATMNQMMAYNQRICRNCQKIMPEYWGSSDRWAIVLQHILGIEQCQCGNAQGRVYLFYDYEKTLSMDNEPKIIKINYFHDKQTGEEINENDYNDTLIKLDELKEAKKLDTKAIAELEYWLENITVTSEEQEQLGAQDYIKRCGVIPEQLLVFAPEYLEDGIDSMRDMIKSKAIDGIIWDSLQAAIPKYVDDRSAEDATMGTEAKQNGILMRKISAAYAPTDIEDEREAYLPPVFLTAQVRANLGFLHAKDSYSGGKAVQHFISTAIEFKRGDFLNASGVKAKKEETYYGQAVNILADKNKIGAPQSKCSFNYYFKESELFPVGFIDYQDELVTIAVENKIIQTGGGGNYSFKGDKIRGFDNLVAKVRTEPDFCAAIFTEVKSLI